MDSAMIGKIKKAKEYAEQPELMQFINFEIDFQGGNSNHLVSFDQGKWHCNCSFFRTHDVCSHTMALERVLSDMLQREHATE